MQDTNYSVATDTAHIKGISLENLFRDYMKSELGYINARARVQVKSSLNNGGINVDVIGDNVDKRRNRLLIIAQTYFALGVLCFAVGWFFLSNALYLYSSWAFSLMFFATGAVSLYLAGKYKSLNGWAECKNQVGVVTFAQMEKTSNQLEAYKASGDKEYRFVKQYFASTSGYSERALKLAKEKEIICYILKNGNFEKVSYWS